MLINRARRRCCSFVVAANHRGISSSTPHFMPRQIPTAPRSLPPSFRSPKCALKCAWPNPCPCFPDPPPKDPRPKSDFTAALLSSAAKEKMYQLHKQDPEVNNVDKLAADFRIRKQRVHAILWLKEMEKEEEAKRGKPLDDRMEKMFESLFGAYNKAQRGEKHVADRELKEEEVEGKTHAEVLQQVSETEESWLIQDFERQMDFCKKHAAGLIPKSHQRPPDGWNYTVELLDPEHRRGRSGGRRFIAESNGNHRPLNELEKTFARRDKVVPRKKPGCIIRPGSLLTLRPVTFAACLRYGMLDMCFAQVDAARKPNKAYDRGRKKFKFQLWHGIREWPPGIVHVWPRKDKTVSKMAKPFPTIRAIRPPRDDFSSSSSSSSAAAAAS